MLSHSELAAAFMQDCFCIAHRGRKALFSTDFHVDDESAYFVARLVFQWHKDRGELHGAEWRFHLDLSVEHLHWTKDESTVLVQGHEMGFTFDPYRVMEGERDYVYDHGPDALYDCAEKFVRRIYKRSRR